MTTNGTFVEAHSRAEITAAIRAWTKGNAKRRIIRAAQALLSAGDFVVRVGSSSSDGQFSGSCVFVARRGFRVWVVRYQNGNGLSSAPNSWVSAYCRPWNGGLSRAEARRAAKAVRAAAVVAATKGELARRAETRMTE